VRISPNPPLEWAEHTSFFDSPKWQGVLQYAFGCHTLYLNSDAQNIATTVTVFPAGPFHIAYFHFPAGLSSFLWHDVDIFARQVSDAIQHSRIDVMRCSVSAWSSPNFKPPKQAIYHQETVIHDLETWKIQQLSKRARRDAYRAQREGFACKVAHDKADASLVYKIYEETIRHRRGTLRYNEKYFRAMVELAGESDDIVTLLAKKTGIQAFMSIVIDRGVAFYLHGGHVRGADGVFAGDFLMLKGIEWAQKRQAKHFNMLASPKKQTGLIRYKEKWGGITSDQWTIDIPAPSLRGLVLKAAMNARAWFCSNQ